MYTYKTSGTCSREITIELEGSAIARVDFVGGCDGNLKALSKLVQGMSVDEVSNLLEGTTCGRRSTSCADQLVKGLKAAQSS